MKMESKEDFEKVMQDYNLHSNGRSLLKYCITSFINFGPNKISDIKKSIQDEIEALNAETAAAYAATAALFSL